MISPNNSINSLKSFLNGCRLSNDDIFEEDKEPNYISYGEIIHGKFYIPDNKINDFLNLYADALNYANFTIIESPRDNTPLYFDIDLKSYQLLNNKRLYNSEDIHHLIIIINKALNKFFNIDKFNYHILEKEKATLKDNIYKDGFHIFIPEIIASFTTKENLFNYIIKQFKVYKDELFNNCINSDIIDKNIIKRAGWFLYGSGKPKNEAYKLTKIFNHKLQDKTHLLKDNTKEDLIKFYSLNYEYEERYKKHITPQNIPDIKTPRPRTPPPKNEDIKTPPPTEETPPATEETTEEDYKPNTQKLKQKTADNLERILKALNQERFKNYNEWLSLAAVVINEGLNLDIFDNISREFKNYNEVNNKKNYETIEKNKDRNIKASLFSLIYYLKEDNPEEHQKIFEEFPFIEINDNLIITGDNVKNKVFNKPFLYDINENDQEQFNYNDFQDNKIIIIESTTGTGKTTATAEHIKKAFEDNHNLKFLSITPLKSLARQHFQSFNNINCQFYQDEKGENKEADELFKARALTICINSIIPFKYMKKEELNNYIVYIDEINSFLSYLSHSSTLDATIKEVYEALIKILKNCHKLILSDAHIKNNVKIFLDNKFKDTDQIIFIKNQFQKYKDIDAEHINDAEEFLKIMKNKIIRNEFFLCGGDSKKEINKIYNECLEIARKDQKENFILITSDSNFKIYNANEQLKDKFVFYSPSVVYGVDFNNIETAQEVFILIKGRTISPSESFQQMARTRNIKRLYFHGNDINKEAPFYTLEETADYYKESIHLSQKLGVISSYFDINDDIQIIENGFFNLFIYNEFLKSAYKSNKIKHFKIMLENSGFNILEDNKDYKPYDKKLNKKMKEDQEKITTEQINDYINDIDKEKPEYSHIHKKAEILKLINNEDLEQFKEYLTDNEKLNKHFKIINYLKTKEERDKIFNRKTANTYKCKTADTVEIKYKLLEKLEEDYNINIKDGLINNNDKPIIFNPDLYKLIVYNFKTEKAQPKKYNEVINLYISMFKNTYGDIINTEKLNTKENRNKTQYQLNYKSIHKELNLLYRRNPELKNIDKPHELINKCNEAAGKDKGFLKLPVNITEEQPENIEIKDGLINNNDNDSDGEYIEEQEEQKEEKEKDNNIICHSCDIKVSIYNTWNREKNNFICPCCNGLLYKCGEA